MGGTSKTQQQTSQTQTQNPYAPTIPGITALANNATGLVGNSNPTAAETGALNTLQANAGQGNPFASQISGVTSDLLGGGVDRTGMAGTAYNDYKSQMSPYLSADYLDPTKAPGMSALLDTIRSDVSNSVNGMFAGAGRDMSGMNVQSLARGLSQGLAAPLLNQYNQNVSAQQNAMGNVYNAGNSTTGILSGLDQTKLANQQAGVGMTDQAMQAQNYAPMQTLAIEAMRRGIPIEQLQQLTGILGPLAGLGGTSSGTATANGTQQMSGAQQFALIANGIGSLMPKYPMKMG